MYRKRLAALVTSSVLLLLAQQTAHAQGFPRAGTPPPQTAQTFSPYLNLLRGGNPAINYYGLVRPEIQFRAGLYGLEQQLQQSQADTAAAQGVGSFQTGHPVQFLNMSHYYAGTGTAGHGGVGRTGAVAPTYPTGGRQQTGGNQPPPPRTR